uniref:glutathione S-transferase T3-like n=1 Tax=Erigeron canadensis TaxID=72917 RepID=UPI001CB98AF9|nr:glutathione S-transferase T3-like [Erigeron canadensis]
MGPSPPCLVNLYSQAYYNQIGYNPVMDRTWTESQRLALVQAQIQAQMQAQMAFDFHHHQQQRPRTSQPSLIINENVPDKDSVASADDEVVEVGRGKRRVTKLKEKRNWEDDDTLLLARCWVHWSQDPVVGNSQTEGIFWKKVVEMFNNETQYPPRTKSQIHGKWNKIKKGVKAFGAALKKVSEHDRQSGADEQQVVDAAVKLYKKQTEEKY